MPDAGRYQPFRDAMRKKHGYCGPYRLGLAIGEAGENLPNPYTNPKSRKVFHEGVETGIRLRTRHQTKVNIRIAIWNAARAGGMAQDPAIALVERAMAEPAMFKALEGLNR